MTLDEEALAYLLQPRDRWIDIEVSICGDENPGTVRVVSRHSSQEGNLLQEFSIGWPESSEPNTEYGYGLSIIHDIKDHYFYGLGITTLTEFQTIVQTYYGREIAGGTLGRAPNGDYSSRIEQAITDELFGPRGARVYGPLETGLLDIYAIDASSPDCIAAQYHMSTICLDIMLPRLKEVYAKHPVIRRLQASTLDQPLLVDTLLPGVKWLNKEKRLLTIRDNLGLRIQARAYVDEVLLATTRGIREAVREYVERHDLLSIYCAIFDTTHYCLDS